jgi:hypothetical protein
MALPWSSVFENIDRVLLERWRKTVIRMVIYILEHNYVRLFNSWLSHKIWRLNSRSVTLILWRFSHIVLWKCRSFLSFAHVKMSLAEPQISESVILLFLCFSFLRTSISFLYIFLIWSRDKYLCSSVGCVRLYFWQRSVCTEVWILRTICSSRTLNYLLVYYVSDMYEKHTLQKKSYSNTVSNVGEKKITIGENKYELEHEKPTVIQFMLLQIR